ncbi:MAG: MATE family efflux transporter [Sulfolobales archaeon]
MLVGSIPDSVISLIGMVVASRIGTEAVAGTGLASYLFFILNALMSIFMVGLLVYCSQAFGAGRRDLIERAVGESLLLSIMLSMAIVLTSHIWISGYTGILSGGQQEVSAVASTYLGLRILSVPAMMVNSVLASSYRAVNLPWIPAYSSIFAGITGAVLIPSLGLGYFNMPKMGIEGMGLASALSQYLGLTVYSIFKPPFRLRLKPPSRVLAKVMAIGVPASIERIVGSLGQNIYINAVAKSGVAALAAHNIGLSVEGIIINPVFAINIAASARVGQRVGSNNVEKLDDLVRESLKIGLSWMSVATAILLALSPFVGRAFTEDANIARLVGTYLVLAAISEVGFGGSLAIYGVIRGMGSTWVPLAVNSFTVIFLRALLAQALQPVYGIYGVWATQITDMYGRFAVSYAIYRKFKSKLLVKLVS